MSYTIVYDSKFIKLSNDCYIMLWLAGDNNVYRGNKRARDWSVCYFNLSEDSIMDKLETVSDSSELFIMHNKWFDKNAYVKMVMSGIKRALTLDEISERNPCAKIMCSCNVYSGGTNTNEIQEFPKSSEELEKWIEKFEERKANKFSFETIYPSVRFLGDEPIRFKNVGSVKGNVIVKSAGRYLFECNERSTRFTSDISKALVFDSIEDAKAKLPFCSSKVSFIDAEKALQRNAEKKFCIVGYDCGNKFYVTKFAKGHLHTSWYVNSAQRFDEKSLEKKLEELNRIWASRYKFEKALISEEEKEK